jgi:murein DD-endopeptidase MepM/ murein hydrolase activator NlpD
MKFSKMHSIALLTCILLAMHAFAAEKPALTTAEAMSLGRKYTAALSANDAVTLWSAMTTKMKTSMVSEENLKLIIAGIHRTTGTEMKVVNERVMPHMQHLMYTRLSKYETGSVKGVLNFWFGRNGQIESMFVIPEKNPAESKYPDYKDKSNFSLPFSGEWTVYWGGRSVYDNYHAASPDQRFAYDLMIIRNGHQYSGDGTKLEDFYSFALPILAPGAGTVVAAVDQYEDNPVLKPNKDAAPQGNTIVIDHGNGEFSMLAHLRHGSLKVKVGDKVKAGQEIALCGNSGNSPIPHLHYHLQTTGQWFKGEGLPIQFKNYVSDGKPVASGEPVRGEVVKNK